jgi:DNA-binding PadR family transcriptional regulator
MSRKDWDFGFEKLFGAGFDPFGSRFDWPRGGRHGRRRRQFFEAGEMKYVILRLLREKPRHGYEIIKALEEKTGGCYSPSAGTVYPTLQLLEDQGLVRIVETDGKKVYHVTAEGERFLDEHKTTIDEIAERLREAVHGVAGGAMGGLHQAFARVAQHAYRTAWRNGPDSETTHKVVEILKRAADEIDAL